MSAGERQGDAPRLLDHRMADGSRNFFDIPERYDAESPEWHRLRRYLGGLEGFAVTRLLTDDVTEAWIDFEHRGHRFSLNNQQGSWWTFVDDPSCPDEVLAEVARALLVFASR